KRKKQQREGERTNDSGSLQHSEIATAAFAGQMATGDIREMLVSAVIGGAKSQPQPGMLTKSGQTPFPRFLARIHEISVLALLVQKSIGGTLKAVWCQQKDVDQNGRKQ